MSKRVFMLFPNFKEKAVTFSYDDGVIYDKKLIEIFNRYGLKGTFNLSSGDFGKGRVNTKENALELYKNPCVEVAVHGYNHLSLANIDTAVATNDVLLNRKELEEMFGHIVKGMAYANGSYDDSVVQILKNCGINYSRTVAQTCEFNLPNEWLKWHPTCHHDNPKLMELAREFVSLERPKYHLNYNPKVMYVWGHSYEFNDKNNWEAIEKFAEFISGREDIWYATNGEIYDYVKAFDSLEYSTDGTKIYNSSGITIYYSNYGKPFKIKPLETVTVCE